MNQQTNIQSIPSLCMCVREEEIEIREWGIRTIWCDGKLSFEAYDLWIKKPIGRSKPFNLLTRSKGVHVSSFCSLAYKALWVLFSLESGHMV